MAQLIKARSSREVVWTSNATAGINLVAQSWGRANLCPGDEASSCLPRWPSAHPLQACTLVIVLLTSFVMLTEDQEMMRQVLVSVAEHHSNLVPWQMVCQATGATLRHVGLTKDTQEIDLQVQSRRFLADETCARLRLRGARDCERY